MRHCIFILVFVSGAVVSYGQTFQWALGGGGSSGDYGNAIATDAAGQSYLTGWFQNTAAFGPFTLTSTGGYDIFLVKVDATGQVLWARQAGGAGTDIGYAVALDGNGVYIAGTYAGTATFGTSLQLTSVNNTPDILVARYDLSGNPVWVYSAGSATDDQAQAIAVHPATGSVYVTGYFKLTCSFGALSVTSAGNSDVFVARYDAAGASATPTWVQTGGSTAYDNAYAICSDAGGNAYASGYFSSTATFGGLQVTAAGDDDVYLVKYNASGAMVWLQGCGGTGLDRGIGLAAYDGQVFCTGWFNGTAAFGALQLTATALDEIFVMAADTGSGTVNWAQKAGGAGYDQGYGICATPSGQIVTTGSFDGTAQFGGVTVTSQGSWDVYIAAYSPAGVFQWVTTGGGPANTAFERDIGYGIQADAMNDIYVTGIIRNTASFGPYSVTSAGIQDVFLAKLSLQTSVTESLPAGRARVYPNPSNGNFTIEIPGNNMVRITVSDKQGRELFFKEVPGGPGISISLPGLAQGNYVLTVQSASGIQTALVSVL